MVEHIVLFRLRADAPPEAVRQMGERLAGLRQSIPGIQDAAFGPNFSARAQGFTHGFVVRFSDRAALENYIPHPAHQSVVQECVKPLSENVLVVDFEI